MRSTTIWTCSVFILAAILTSDDSSRCDFFCFEKKSLPCSTACLMFLPIFKVLFDGQIALRTVTIYRPETQTKKLKLT